MSRTITNTSYAQIHDRHTTTEISALVAETGALVYDTTLNVVKIYDGTSWKEVSFGIAPQNLENDDVTLTAADSGKEFNIATDAKTFTLPLIAAGNLGMSFLFRNTGADGNNTVTISPNALDAIHGTIANAAADSVAGGVVNKDIVNTKATANKGDFIILTAVAATEWYITGGIGIWASEA